MRNHLSRIGLLTVLAMSLVGFCAAQEFSYRVAANIPVDFYVGDQHMPAGNYLFIVNYENHAVTVQNQDNRQNTVVVGSPVMLASPGYSQRDIGTTVQLNSVRGRYVLANVITRNDGVTFSESRVNGMSASNERGMTILASLR